MKALFVILLAALVAAVAAIGYTQWKRNAAHKAELAVLQAELAQKAAEASEIEAARKHADEDRDQLLKLTSEMGAQLGNRQQTSDSKARPAGAEAAAVPVVPGDGSGGSDQNSLGKFLSKMMSDPDTKQLIRTQQRMMMDQLYAPLVRQMGLTPDEAEKFKDIMADNLMQGAEKASTVFGSSATNRTEMLAGLAAEQKTFDEQVRNMLGEARYTQYKEYQQTLGERTQLNLFRQQTAGSDTALNDRQAEQLLAFMKEEKQAVSAVTGQAIPETGQDPETLRAVMSEEQGGKLVEAQEMMNQRVFHRAAQVLSPEQLQSFGRFQTNQLAMMRMGMTMARKMFGSGAAEPNSPNSPQ